MTSAIATDHLTKRFGRKRAVDDLMLDVPRGEVFCFLGRNGAGKSTTIRMLLGLVRPSAGAVSILGKPIRFGGDAALRKVGAIVEQPAFYESLSAERNLKYFALPAGGATREEIARAIELVGLAGRERDAVRTYSQGMKQRLALAASLVPAPELVILDEPTNGLDPQGIREIRGIIRRLADDEGITVFLSSHLLSEVEQLADRLAIIEQGRLVYQGRLDRLPRTRAFQVTADPVDRAAVLLEERLDVRPGRLPDGTLEFDIDGHDPAAINRMLVEEGVKVARLSFRDETLEDIFLRLTGTAT